MSDMRWVVLGAGYTGSRVVAALAARGEDVTGTRRATFELTPTADTDWLTGATVVCCAPPGPDPGGEIARLRPAGRLIYVSSTGVYAPGRGAWVDEAWPIAPSTAAGAARVLAERAAAAHPAAVALRVAGIHGPGRGLIDRIRAGTYRVIGDGTTAVSRIHVDDLVTAIIACGDRPAVTGAINIADDDPAPIGEVADAVAAHFGLPPPPRVAPDEVAPDVAGMLLANRRIANHRMKRELGVALRYPSWRTALSQAAL